MTPSALKLVAQSLDSKAPAPLQSGGSAASVDNLIDVQTGLIPFSRAH